MKVIHKKILSELISKDALLIVGSGGGEAITPLQPKGRFNERVVWGKFSDLGIKKKGKCFE